jgi:hypothetical protein
VCICTGLTAGSVYVQATAEEAIDLSCIVEITDSLEIDGTNASSVDFSGLTHVDGELKIIDNLEMQSVDFSSLASVDGPIYVQSNNELVTVAMGSVSSADGDVRISSNPELENLPSGSSTPPSTSTTTKNWRPSASTVSTRSAATLSSGTTTESSSLACPCLNQWVASSRSKTTRTCSKSQLPPSKP